MLVTHVQAMDGHELVSTEQVFGIIFMTVFPMQTFGCDYIYVNLKITLIKSILTSNKAHFCHTLEKE